MITLVVPTPRIQFSPSIAFGILKAISKADVKCMDLNSKFRDEFNRILVEEAKKINWKMVDLDNYFQSIPLANARSFHKAHLYLSYMHHDFQFQLLEGLENKMQKLYDKMTKEILKTSPEIVGLTANAESLGTTLNLAKRLHTEDIKTVIGGSGTLLTWKYLNYPFIDAIVLGEGELIFKKMIASLKKGQRKKIWYSDKLIEMDKIPIPDYNDFKIEDYKYMGIETNRGCIYRCAFCAMRFTPFCEIYREKSIGKVKEEIKLIKNYGKPVFFVDNTINPNKMRIMKLAKMLKGKDIEWVGAFRATIDEETAKILKESGCIEAQMGCESLSDYVLKKMNKNISAATIMKSLKNLHEVGIKTRPNFFFGFPGERLIDVFITWRRITQIRDYIDDLNVGWFKCIPDSLVHKYPERYKVKVFENNERWTAFHQLVPIKLENKLNYTIKFWIIDFLHEFYKNLKVK